MHDTKHVGLRIEMVSPWIRPRYITILRISVEATGLLRKVEFNVMQIQVNTDNHTEGNAELTRHVETVVEDALGWFGDRITRVEVHLSDENGRQKSGENYKRCLIEARVAGIQPVTASSEGATLQLALDSAVDKLEKTLERKLGRRDDPKGRISFSGDSS